MKKAIMFFILAAVIAPLTLEERAIINKGKISAEEISILGRGYISFLEIYRLRINTGNEK
jgi:hypothetical protein